MSYHYHVNNVGGSEFFDSTSYIPQMQMHHGYHDFYPNDASSSMMTSTVTPQPQTDGTLMMPQQQPTPSNRMGDHGGYGWRQDWSTSSQWMPNAPIEHGGGHMGGMVAPHLMNENTGQELYSFRQMPLTNQFLSSDAKMDCYLDQATPSRIISSLKKETRLAQRPIARTHTGERPYPCAQCEKAFTDSSTLTKHLRTHTGHKPYVCSICMMKFTQSGNLHRHMKTHK
uniref:C2H2-type domain-containing protein n=1 Tax=Caenorhabditis japonica TaxID=281687 RepID=A0A8R1I4L0_CAEJA